MSCTYRCNQGRECSCGLVTTHGFARIDTEATPAEPIRKWNVVATCAWILFFVAGLYCIGRACGIEF